MSELGPDAMADVFIVGVARGCAETFWLLEHRLDGNLDRPLARSPNASWLADAAELMIALMLRQLRRAFNAGDAGLTEDSERLARFAFEERLEELAAAAPAALVASDVSPASSWPTWKRRGDRNRCSYIGAPSCCDHDLLAIATPPLWLHSSSTVSD